MYKGKNIKENNLKQKQKAIQFLESKKVDPKQIHFDSSSSSSQTNLSDLLQRLETKQTCQVKKPHEYKQEQQQKQYCKPFFQKSKVEEFIFSSESELDQPMLNNPQPKGKKSKKRQKKKSSENLQRVINETETYHNLPIIRKQNQNLVTVDVLKPKGPLVRNYVLANQLEWENKKGVEDYKLKFVLRKFPNIRDFKNNQKAIIKCSLLGNDVFVCMPTGGGKSLTFQVMTYIEKGVYLCIMPLVSLIFDQEYQAKKMGITAFSLTSTIDISENRNVYDILSHYDKGNESIVILCTPEKIFKNQKFFSLLQELYEKKALVKIVIDQVHCVSTWGKQFRHEYENLSKLRKFFPRTPILGLTATVTETIKQDIIKRLGMQNCFFFQSSFNRPNLIYSVREKTKSVFNQIVAILERYRGKSGIIYCLSRKNCEQIFEKLLEKKYKVAYYHANISEEDKKSIQSEWMDDKIHIIIATIAFGMGINKPDVRFVIHHSMSKSLENYYQESGRAGRDGEQAECILFYSKNDKQGLQNLTLKNESSKQESKNFCMRQLSNMFRYCEEKFQCRRKFQLNYLGQTDFDVEMCNATCDNCKKRQNHITVEGIKGAKLLVDLVVFTERIRFSLSSNQIVSVCKNSISKKIKYKIDKLEQNYNLDSLRQYFLSWSKNQIQDLVLILLSQHILEEKIVYSNVRNNFNVSNIYIKPNYLLCKRFLNQVQTLPLKRKGKSFSGKDSYQELEMDPDFGDYAFQQKQSDE